MTNDSPWNLGFPTFSFNEPESTIKKFNKGNKNDWNPIQTDIFVENEHPSMKCYNSTDKLWFIIKIIFHEERLERWWGGKDNKIVRRRILLSDTSDSN